MTRINVYKTPVVFSKFFIAFGALFTVLGISLLIRALINNFDTEFPSGDWNSVLYTVQGLLFIVMGVSGLISRKYYIEWNDQELSYFLPYAKRTETIKFDDVVSINIKLFEIQLNLTERTVILDLNSLQFEDLKMIKEKFELLARDRK
jgi:uncharacterized membrane protein